MNKLSGKFKNKIWIFTIYFSLLIVGIPWYWSEDSDLMIYALPAWVFVAILVSFLTSLFTAFLLLRYPWQLEDDADE